MLTLMGAIQMHQKEIITLTISVHDSGTVLLLQRKSKPMTYSGSTVCLSTMELHRQQASLATACYSNDNENVDVETKMG